MTQAQWQQQHYGTLAKLYADYGRESGDLNTTFVQFCAALFRETVHAKVQP